MAFCLSGVFGQGYGLLAYAVLGGVAGSACWQVSRAYARVLPGGWQADFYGMAAATRLVARGYARKAAGGASACLRRRTRWRGVRWGPAVSTIVLAMGFAAIVAPAGNDGYALLACVAATLLLLLAQIDARTGLLPDVLTRPLLVLGLLAAGLGLGEVSLHDALMGAVMGYLFLWLLLQGFRYLRGVDGMGRGDLKLLSALGAWLGWQVLPWLLLTACVMGLALAMLRQNTLLPSGAYPFGPFMATAAAGVFAAQSGVHLWFC